MILPGVPQRNNHFGSVFRPALREMLYSTLGRRLEGRLPIAKEMVMMSKTSAAIPASAHFDRRSALTTLALGGLAIVGGFGFASPAYALAQEGWRWCNKCQGMFYGLHPTGLGACPAGGAHNPSQSGYYYIRVEGAVSGVQQDGWSWCKKCMGFFYSGGASMGYCPTGGAHTNQGSGAYAAILGGNSTQRQGGWRWCKVCMGMFYSGYGAGACPAGGGHNSTGSGQYAFLT
jgi:hypothetical protein